MSWPESPDSQAQTPPQRRDPTVDEMLAQIERLDFVYEAMEKVWAEIQRNLRPPNTWRL